MPHGSPYERLPAMRPSLTSAERNFQLDTWNFQPTGSTVTWHRPTHDEGGRDERARQLPGRCSLLGDQPAARRPGRSATSTGSSSAGRWRPARTTWRRTPSGRLRGRDVAGDRHHARRRHAAGVGDGGAHRRPRGHRRRGPGRGRRGAPGGGRLQPGREAGRVHRPGRCDLLRLGGGRPRGCAARQRGRAPGR